MNVDIPEVGGDWHLCIYPFDGWPTMSSELWIQLSLLVVATGSMAAAHGSMLIGSVGDHGIIRHRFTGKKNNRTWCVVWMVHKVYKTILHLAVLSSTITVDQTELYGVFTGYPAHKFEVELAEGRPQEQFIHSHAVPTGDFPQAHVEFARDAQRGLQDGGVPRHGPQQATMSMET